MTNKCDKYLLIERLQFELNHWINWNLIHWITINIPYETVITLPFTLRRISSSLVNSPFGGLILRDDVFFYWKYWICFMYLFVVILFSIAAFYVMFFNVKSFCVSFFWWPFCALIHCKETVALNCSIIFNLIEF